MVETQVWRRADTDGPEVIHELPPLPADEAFDRPVTPWRRLADNPAARQVGLLVLAGVVWQVYAVQIDNPLVLPSLSETVEAFWRNLTNGQLLARALTSVRTLGLGFGLAVVIAILLTGLAAGFRLAADGMTLAAGMFNPLPAIALLPLALLWFGIGEWSLVFVLIHAVLWPLSLNIHAGFLGVGETLRLSSRSFGVSGWRFAALILVPAALPAIVTGLKIGWAFAWRTLIAAELVFGVSSGAGGLGWFIFQNRNQLEIANVFAGILTVILIGLFVEVAIFRTVERLTLQRWGMQRPGF